MHRACTRPTMQTFSHGLYIAASMGLYCQSSAVFRGAISGVLRMPQWLASHACSYRWLWLDYNAML